MELLQLKYFCETAKTQNLSETARKYNVPTSNISRSIKRLEAELDCEFFDHLANKIFLNEKGEIFYKKVSAALTLLNDAKIMIKENSNLLSGEINLCCKSNRRIVIEAMEEFIKVYPNVKFKTFFGREATKDTDILISCLPPLDSIKRVLVIEEDLLLAIHKDNPLSSVENLKISDLKNEHFIIGLANETDTECKKAGFVPNIAFESNDPTYVRKYIEMGLGIAFIPSVSWRNLFSDNIVLKNVGIKRKTYAYIPQDKYTKKSVTVFLEYLIAAAKKATEEYNSTIASLKSTQAALK
jgi:DNA-binding transcriptional LysR family regulator